MKQKTWNMVLAAFTSSFALSRSGRVEGKPLHVVLPMTSTIHYKSSCVVEADEPDKANMAPVDLPLLPRQTKWEWTVTSITTRFSFLHC